MRERSPGYWQLRVFEGADPVTHQRGDLNRTIRWLLRLLERDPYDEEAHLRLVSTLEKAGGHGEARRRFRLYVDRMEEIAVEAAPFPSPVGA